MASSHTNLSRCFVFLVFIHFVLCHICNGAYHGSTLYSSETLRAWENLVNGPYSLVFRDCRLQLLDSSHEKGNPVWESRTTKGHLGYCSCLMQDDGNLVVSGDNSWAALKEGKERGNYVLVLRFDRNMAIYGPALWSSGTYRKSVHRHDIENHAVKTLSKRTGRSRGYILYCDRDWGRLTTGDFLEWGKYTLRMEPDCNLVLYDDEESIWSTNTAGAGTDCYLQITFFGRLALYDGNHQEQWSANTTAGAHEYDKYVLILQDNGDIVLYDKAIWQTFTYDPSHPKYTETTTATNGIATVV